MVRSCVHTKSGPAIGVYMVMVREYMAGFLPPEVEKEVKEAIKRVGGTCNQSGLFLATTSEEAVVNRKTGINRRSVVYIPRSQVSKDLLLRLDKCKSFSCVLLPVGLILLFN